MAPPARSSCSSRPSSRVSPTSTACTRTMGPADRAGAVLEVDLAAIVANWRLLCARHPSGPVAGVVKADGYGLGAEPVVRALYAEGCRYFFVALLDEALAICTAAPDAMIAVLGGLIPGSERDYCPPASFRTPRASLPSWPIIVPVLGSLAEIDSWAAIGRTAGRS